MTDERCENHNGKPFVLEEATVASVHEAMLDGRLTCRQLIEGCLARIEAYDKKGPALNAVILVNPKALEEADRLDERFRADGLTGPLHGIPVLLKDNCETYDMPTTAGSLSLEGFETHKDAFITKKLREAGAIIIAKTNLHEFAVWGETISSILGQSYNPYDHTRTPGGSSGGTGAGLAANYGVVGIGTDTINSIRSPSSACSLVGIRPTIGLVSRDGIVPYSLTQDTAGPLARTVADAAAVLDVIAGSDPKDPVTETCLGKIPTSYLDYLDDEGLRGRRIGVLRSFFGPDDDLHREVNACMEKSLQIMRDAGAELVDIAEKIDSGYLVKNVSVHIHDLKTHLGQYLEGFGDAAPIHSLADVLASGKYHPGLKSNLDEAMGYDVGTPAYNERLKKRAELQKQVLAIMDEYAIDAIVYPHQQQLVCKTGGSQQERNGVIGSVTGYPAVVVPAGFSSPSDDAPIGVPVGMEILGRPFAEPQLISIAYGFEQHSHLRRPPLSTPPLA